ncbi:cupin domain-containing protein [Alteribacillus sp. JSM 102045]|uniref:cupin domain-containing protein n=1 Tax=Alteribacillus sp. JSM 102045 TaxID=1562101 RepID=UPI0035C1F7E6
MEMNTFMESQEVKEFNKKIQKDELGPLWNAIPQLVSKEPPSHAEPYLWKGSVIKKHLMEATNIFTPERGGERRAIYLQNPKLKDREPWGWGAATQNIYAAVQLILPGEEAPSHRHKQSALRFIMEGEGAYSIVDGERLFMNEGDFVVTPQECWHGHGHEGEEPMFWMDVLDIPFIYSVGGSFFEGYPEDGIQKPERKDNYSPRHYQGGLVRPIKDRKPKKAPVGTYKWKQTKEALDGLEEFSPDEYDGYAVEFINPTTGDTANVNIASWMQRFPVGYHGKAHRHTNSSVVHVHSGSGYTVIDGVKFEWEKGDFFVIPSWTWHEHVNTGDEPAHFFSVHDTPIMETFHLQKEEANENGEGQKVKRVFQP